VSIATDSASGYLPGNCNIGTAEIRQRWVVSLVGLGFAISSAIGLVAANAPATARLGVFLPLMVWATGMMQARKKFCMAYGLAGTFSITGLGKISRVADPALRRIDRIAAMRLLMQSAIVAGAVTALFALAPL
jgi:hypothetical protein